MKNLSVHPEEETSYKEKEALRLVGSQQNCFSSFWPFSITCWAPSVKSGDTTAENQSEDSKFTSWTRSSTVMEFAVCPVFPGGDEPAESQNRWVYCLWDQQMYWKDVICTIIHFVWYNTRWADCANIFSSRQQMMLIIKNKQKSVTWLDKRSDYSIDFLPVHFSPF